MTSENIQLYQAKTSPNSRRVRIFLAEKNLSIPLQNIDLSAAEQHSDAYRKINPRRVVPTLAIDDGTSIGEVPAILRYLEEVYPEPPLMGRNAKEKALVTMWERRMELEGFAPVMEGIRNDIPRLQGRAIAGPYDYDQIPALVPRSRQRVENFFRDLNERLQGVPFVAGQDFSVADITALVAVDFAAGALGMSLPGSMEAAAGWYEKVSKRPSASA
jgi:glutathione S-transferase